ncbi:hypothetical protein LINPERPRIM_LOCUS14635 [Linum perenne]
MKVESRPQRKRPLRVVDDSNIGIAKNVTGFKLDFPTLTSMSTIMVTM